MGMLTDILSQGVITLLNNHSVLEKKPRKANRKVCSSIKLKCLQFSHIEQFAAARVTTTVRRGDEQASVINWLSYTFFHVGLLPFCSFSHPCIPMFLLFLSWSLLSATLLFSPQPVLAHPINQLPQAKHCMSLCQIFFFFFLHIFPPLLLSLEVLEHHTWFIRRITCTICHEFTVRTFHSPS